jgi:uncharacterized protein YcfL
MKVIHSTFLSVSAAALLLCSCSSHNAAKLLNDPKLAPEIMHAICADPGLMAEMSDQMSKSDAAQQSLLGSKDLMRVMHTEKHLSQMMRNDSSMANIFSVNLVGIASQDSVLRREMTDVIMQNSRVRGSLEKAMHESGKTGKDKKHKGSHKKGKGK